MSHLVDEITNTLAKLVQREDIEVGQASITTATLIQVLAEDRSFVDRIDNAIMRDRLDADN